MELTSDIQVMARNAPNGLLRQDRGRTNCLFIILLITKAIPRSPRKIFIGARPRTQEKGIATIAQ
jgi:hypothetical protein